MNELPQHPEEPAAAVPAPQPPENDAPQQQQGWNVQHELLARRDECLAPPAMAPLRPNDGLPPGIVTPEQSPNASPVRDPAPEELPMPLAAQDGVVAQEAPRTAAEILAGLGLPNIVPPPGVRLPPFSQPWATRRYPTAGIRPVPPYIPPVRPSQNNFGIVIPPRRHFQPLGYPATPEEIRNHARQERARMEENELERENLRLLVRARRFLEDARMQAAAMGRQLENREARRRRQPARMNHFQAMNMAPRREEPPVARMTEEEDNSDTDSSRCGSPTVDDQGKQGEVAVQTVDQSAAAPDAEAGEDMREYMLRNQFVSGRRQH